VSIFDWLGARERDPVGATEAETRTVREIVDRLEHLEPERARYVAAFAYVLSRVARADLEITPQETRAMERIVASQGGLPEAEAVIVVQMAKTQNLLFGGTENYLVTRELGRIATLEQKLGLLDCLFAVSCADESITSVEDGVIRQVAAELRLPHRDYIAVRARYRDRLAVMQDPEPPAGSG
jgi:uncharacterized tellurite resistance protein B-like protein